MNRRERFHKVTSFQEADRVPLDMGSHVASIHRRAYANLGRYLNDKALTHSDLILDRMVQNVVPDEKLLQRYNIDFRWIAPRWIGVTNIEREADGASGYRDMWGIEWQHMGDAFAVSRSPLSSATSVADIDAHRWPDPTDKRLVAGLAERAKWLYENTDYVLVADSVKGGLLTTALQVRGYQEMFTDVALNLEMAAALLDKLLALYKQFWTTFLDAVGPYVQMVYFTDDIGGQKTMMISPRTFRKLLKPRLAALIDHIKSRADVKFMYHTDGTVTPVIEDIIEMGVDVLNPIQTSAMGMDTAVLKELYHERLCFHGAIDVQQMLPFSTPDEVRYDVAKRIHDLGRGGGYIVAPCHNIGPDVPPGNIEALYEAATEFGRYPLQLNHILTAEDRKRPTPEQIAAQTQPAPRPRRRRRASAG